jgi:hypothetical protein
MRTSLITDPKDGKLPPQTPDAVARAAATRVITSRGAEGPEDRPLSERCITRGNAGPPMLPAGYNNNFQIVQSKDTVAILVEQIHDVRIVPLVASTHLSGDIRQWLGDSRGHFEGDTLVVESTNFKSQTNFRNADANLKVVERFTRVAPDTMKYEFTVTDPTVWTAPFSAEIIAPRLDGVIYEYACHEGNYGMEGTLSGARYLEKAAEAAKKGSNSVPRRFTPHRLDTAGLENSGPAVSVFSRSLPHSLRERRPPGWPCRTSSFSETVHGLTAALVRRARSPIRPVAAPSSWLGVWRTSQHRGPFNRKKSDYSSPTPIRPIRDRWNA